MVPYFVLRLPRKVLTIFLLLLCPNPLSCKTLCANPLRGQGLGFVIAVAGPDNDNDNNDKNDDDGVALASAISLGLATLVLGARSFANPQDLVVETIVLRHYPCEHDLSESRDIGVLSMMQHRPCERNISKSRDIGVSSTVRHDRLRERNLPESRDICVASMISCNFVVFRAINLVTSDLCVGSPRRRRKRSDGSCLLIVVSTISLIRATFLSQGR
jgi:hypothetical protein